MTTVTVSAHSVRRLGMVGSSMLKAGKKMKQFRNQAEKCVNSCQSVDNSESLRCQHGDHTETWP